MARTSWSHNWATYTGRQHTKQRGRDKRPNQELNGREEEEKTGAKPNTKVDRRQEEEREKREENRKQHAGPAANMAVNPGPKLKRSRRAKRTHSFMLGD